MNPRTAIDLTATVTTPENIQFEYRIAGPFRRLPAFVLDLVIRVGALVGVSIAISCSGIGTALALPGSLVPVVITLSVFLLDWFYGLFFETYWNGKTPGKWFTKIQVISADGRPISAYQATIRNFLRAADIAPYLSLELFDPNFPPMYGIPTGLVAFLCMSVTKRFQRLGDLAAGTMVVVDERSWIPPNVKLEDPRVEALAQFIPPSFRMSRSMGRAIALYAERRSRMPVARRMELASILAKPLMQQFSFRDDTSPDLLLCALYYREFVVKQISGPGESGGPSKPMRASPYTSAQAEPKTAAPSESSIGPASSDGAVVASVIPPPILVAEPPDSSTTAADPGSPP